MNEKNDVDVIINNKRYTLSGYVSHEYLQKVATFINNKYSEFKLQPGYRNLDNDMKNVLMAINIADDYFKAQKQVDEFQSDIEIKDKEIFDLKHEFISLQSRLESSEKKLSELKSEHEKAMHDIIRLETELGKSTRELKVMEKTHNGTASTTSKGQNNSAAGTNSVSGRQNQNVRKSNNGTAERH